MKKNILGLLCRLGEESVYNNKSFVSFHSLSYSNKVEWCNYKCSLQCPASGVSIRQAGWWSASSTRTTEMATAITGAKRLVTPLKSPNDPKEYRLHFYYFFLSVNRVVANV